MNLVKTDEFGLIVSFFTIENVAVVPEGFIQPPLHININNFGKWALVKGEFIEVGEKPTLFSVYRNGWVINRNSLSASVNKLINQKRDNDFLLTVVFDGLVFDADKAAITNIQSTLLIFQQTGQLPEGFEWRTHDNQTVPMTYEKLEGLAQAIYARNAQIYAESWALKDSLNSKTDDELLALYDSLAQSPV